MIENIKNELANMLNSSAFTTDSIEGWLLIFLTGFLIWNIYKKAVRFIIWSFSAILLLQVLYFLGQTGLDNIIPISSIFKYDVLTSIAQCFVGTKICDGLLWVNAFIRTVCFQSYNFITTGTVPHT